MDYVSTFIEFASDHWKEILATATAVAALAYGLAKKWKQIKSR